MFEVEAVAGTALLPCLVCNKHIVVQSPMQGVLFLTSFLCLVKKMPTASQPSWAAGLARPFYIAAEITPSQGGRHSGCEPEPPALHLKLVSLLSAD